MTTISLHGSVAVKASARKALPALVSVLDPDADDVIVITDDVLTVNIGSCDVPAGFHATACKAITEFCEKHAANGAVFDYDGSALLVGPGSRAKKDAHAAYLIGRIRALSEELENLMKSPD